MKGLRESPTVRKNRELLGVGPEVTASELKKAYYRLARLYHPDQNPTPDAAQQFDKIKQAYEILGDAVHIRHLNQNYLKERLFHFCFEGLNISFGSFFGYRVFSAGETRVVRGLRLGKEKAGEADIDDSFQIEEGNSILDNSAYDNLELVYAGKLSLEDEEVLVDSIEGVVRLPWVVLNNQGILAFLDGNFNRARKCYEELNERIPHNIIFMYRLALCYILLAFQNPKRTLLGVVKPDRILVEKGLLLLRQAIVLGETRKFGKQKCLTIRKTLADVCEKMGKRRQARKIWQEIYDLQPKSLEALLKLQGPKVALAEAKKRAKTNSERATKVKLLKGT